MSDLNDKREVLSEFQAKVDHALMQGQEWVETSDEIIKYYNPKGLNGAEYFIFKGVKVAPYEQSASIQERLDQPMAERLHGDGQGKLERTR